MISGVENGVYIDRCVSCNEQLEKDDDYEASTVFLCDNCDDEKKGRYTTYREELRKYLEEQQKLADAYDSDEALAGDYIRDYTSHQQWDDVTTDDSDNGASRVSARESIKVVKKDKKKVSAIEDQLFESESEESTQSSDDGIIEPQIDPEEDIFEIESDKDLSEGDNTSLFYSESDYRSDDSLSDDQDHPGYGTNDSSDESFAYTNMDGKTIRVKGKGLDSLPDGATSEEIDALDTHKVRKEEKGMDCFICDHQLKTGQVVSLGCEHTFHHICLIKWLQVKAICPSCHASIRRPLSPTFEDEYWGVYGDTTNSEYDSYSSRDTEPEE